jgi:FkbM family methyltransferase
MLESRGYYLRHKAVLPYGVDYIRDISELSKSFKLPIKTVFDVGAHFGETSQRALNAFSGCRVVAFEPAPDSFKCLTTNISCSRFAAHPIALSDADGSGLLHLNRNNLRHSLLQFDSDAPTIEVNCRSIDSFCEEHGITSIDVLKVDTEGHDIAVLRGSSRMLASTKFVYCEFFHLTDESQGATLLGLHNLLYPHGLSFVAAYTDSIERTSLGPFAVMNALFIRRG